MAEAAEKKLENDFTTLRQKHHQEKESLRKTMSGLLNQADNEKDLQNELNVLSDKFSASLSDLDEKQQELRELRKELDTMKVDKERYEKDAKLLPSVKQEVTTLREKLYAVEEKNAELEAALEEIGPQLSISKLKILELREETLPMTGEWQKDGEVAECNACQLTFTMAKRKHHCRACGRIFCSTCSSGRIRLPSSSQPVRVCSACFHHLQLVYDPTESRQS
ncbi:unnamed protein product, partial [Mesorhabditis belari]|uniref:FYVE-type domain-containing protein n=1 Tax=Mesorhabditis belari TaxID=2138241 RepID=A0AAF3FCC3_9BILA